MGFLITHGQRPLLDVLRGGTSPPAVVLFQVAQVGLRPMRHLRVLGRLGLLGRVLKWGSI
jgi:hypothetical protein